MVAKVGPVKAKFGGNVTLSKLKPPESYHISGQGKGGAAGFAKGAADVRLTEAEGGTLLSYDVDAQVGGKLAQIGSRLIDSTARKMAADFFKRFAKLAASDMQIAGEEKPAAKARPKTRTAAKAKTTAKAKTAAAKTKTAAKSAARPTRKSAKAEKAPAPKAEAAPEAAPAAAPEAKAPPAAATTPQPSAPASAPEAKSNAWLWIIAAAVVVLLIAWFSRG